MEQQQTPRRNIKEIGPKANLVNKGRFSMRNNGSVGFGDMLKTPNSDYPNQSDNIKIPNINQRTKNMTPTPNADFLRESLRDRGGLKGLTDVRNLPL